VSFLTPFAFAGLSLGALIAALYYLKKRPQPFEVSALFLWPQASSRSRSAWRWYKAPLGLLLLQLLVLVLLVGSLGQPVVFTQAQSAGRMLVVLDTSASMRAKTANGTRFQQAKQRAFEFIQAHSNGEFMLIEARKQGGVVVPLSSDVALIQQALSSLAPTLMGDAPLSDVVQWALSQAPWESFDRVVWFGDRLPTDPGWQDYGIEFSLSGQAVANAAITAFTVRLQPDVTLGYEGFVRVQNFSNTPLETTLSLTAPGGFSSQAPLAVPAGGQADYTFPLSNTIPKRLSVSLAQKDGLDFDNQRYFSFHTRISPKVYWLGKPDPFFEQALAVSGVKSVTPWTPGTSLKPTDVLIVYEETLPAGTQGNLLLIDAGWEDHIALGGSREVARIRATDLTHPVLFGVTPENLVVASQQVGALPEGFVPLFEANGPSGEGFVPLMGLYQESGNRMAWFGFSLDRSNLRLTVDFPILVANLLKWLAPLPIESSVLETGDPIPLNATNLSLTLPSKRSVLVKRDTFLDTLTPGFYASATPFQVWAVYVPAEESKAANGPLDAGVAPAKPAFLARQQETVVNPFWFYLSLLGLIVLGLEWISYERGWL